MKFAEFSVKNALFVNLISLFIFIWGVVSIFSLRREAFPQVSFDVVTVRTTFRAAPPEDVEKLVTIPLEKEIKTVSDVKEINSSSDEGLSTIGITIQPDARDKDKVVTDIQRAVDRVKDLPADADDPLVTEITTKETPIIEISLSGDMPEYERRQYAESLEDQLLDIPQVASVQRIGWRDREFQVELNPDKLKEYHVSMAEVMEALKTRNITVPGGQLTMPSVEFNIRTTAEFTTPQEIDEVVIRANDAGNWLKIRDVGKTVDTFEDETRIAKVNGRRTLAMVVVKRELADAITTVDKVRKVAAEFKRKLPVGVEIAFTNDFSYYVKRRLNVLTSNGILGFFLVVIILFLFLDPIPAFMTAAGIPFALLVTFGVMNFLGMSLNLITMLGLIIVLGMLVDDGIIVSENIFRHLENGVPLKDAVIRGTSEVISPIVGSIITTWAAFFPLLFMKDIIGKFIQSIPLVVIIALAASMLEAFVVLPSHLYEFIKNFNKGSSFKKSSVRERPWLRKFIAFYTDILKKALNNRYKVFWGTMIVFALTIYVAAFHMKVILFTGEGIERFFIRAEAKMGTPLEKMDELIKPVEDLVGAMPKAELDSYRTYLGSIETESAFDPRAKRGTHLGQVSVFLTPLQKRHRMPKEIIASLRSGLDKIPGFEKLYFFSPREGPPVGMPVSIGIKGEDFAVLEEIAGQFTEALKGVAGVSDVDTSYDFGKKQLKVVVDEEKAQKYFLTINQIATQVKNAIKGGVATSIKPEQAQEDIDVLVRFPKAKRNDLSTFHNILIPNRFGNLVPLTSVARIEETEGIYVINHLDGKRVITVTADVDNKKASSLSVNQLLRNKFSDIPEKYLGYTVKYGGEYEEQRESSRNLLISFTLALLFIFIVLAREFRSVVQPFVIMLTIPFGIIGVVFAFLTHGRPLSFFALMGLVGLTGVVVNNAIVLLDFINKLREEGKDRRTSIVEACQIRIRPVLSTSITTILGLVSVAYGIGGSDPFLKPMGLTLVWGLFFSTILTLLVIPCIYAILDDLSEKFFHHATVKIKADPSVQESML